MAKWLCRCGATLTTSEPIPHPDGLYVVPEERYDERADAGDFDLDSCGGAAGV
jgi:hypothetical protein